jgi:hypothetical protein
MSWGQECSTWHAVLSHVTQKAHTPTFEQAEDTQRKFIRDPYLLTGEFDVFSFKKDFLKKCRWIPSKLPAR